MHASAVSPERGCDHLGYAVGQVVHHFDFAAPGRWLSTCGVQLQVRPEPLRLPGRTVRGTWDPLLRRIELFDVQSELPDRELVRTFAHELYHALRGQDEALAVVFAERFVDFISAEQCATCATALRALVPLAGHPRN